MKKLLRRLLDDSEARARLAAIDAVQAVIEFKPDGTIVNANPRFLDTMGYALGEIAGRHHRMFVEPGHAESREYADFWARLAQGRTDAGLYKRLDKHGREVWLQSSYNPIRNRLGQVTRIVKYATDVTAEQRQAADMQSRLKAIDRAQGVIEFDLDGTILDVNDNFLRAVGYDRDEVQGQHHRMFVSAEEARSEQYARFWQKLRTGTHDAGLYRRLGRGGRPVWIQATYNPVLDASGRPVRVIKYATDVTAQTLAAQTLQSVVGGLSDTVKDNALKAQEARGVTDSAHTAAREGGEVVGDVVRTMGAIEDSMHAITEATDLIDSLAFQSNLLSLNATIEAAHAGQMGRGFAVVAAEVRDLAQRSKEGARQIHALLETASRCVVEGRAFADAAGESMRGIIHSVTDATRIVGAIHESAELQSTGIRQVNAAAGELERVFGHG